MIIFGKIWYFFVLISVRIGLEFFYKKITTTGKENLPKGVPIIFAANHENTFMDALLIATFNFRLCNFLVRADVFKNSISSWFFSTLNMLPVYRIRDGFSSLKNNGEAFEACYAAFAKSEALILFPEANHDIRRIPRKLTKGISRIALGAMNAENAPEKLYIVPLGLSYSAHEKFRSTAQINFGQPILVEKHPVENKYLSDLRYEVEEGLSKVHIGLPLEKYELLDNLIFGIEGRINLADYKQINQDGAALNKCILEGKEVDELKKQSEVFGQLILKFKSNLTNGKGLTVEMLLSILMLPIFIYGAVFNSPILLLIYAIDKRVIKNRIFKGSVNYITGLYLFPILWNYEYGFIVEVYGVSIDTYLYLLSLPISLYAFQVIKDFYSKLIGKFRFVFDKKSAKDFIESQAYLRAFKSRCLSIYSTEI